MLLLLPELGQSFVKLLPSLWHSKIWSDCLISIYIWIHSWRARDHYLGFLLNGLFVLLSCRIRFTLLLLKLTNLTLVILIIVLWLIAHILILLFVRLLAFLISRLINNFLIDFQFISEHKSCLFFNLFINMRNIETLILFISESLKILSLKFGSSRLMLKLFSLLLTLKSGRFLLLLLLFPPPEHEMHHLHLVHLIHVGLTPHLLIGRGVYLTNVLVLTLII